MTIRTLASNFYRKLMLSLTVAGLSVAPSVAIAGGSSGSVSISKILIENGRVFIFANNIANPDSCQTSDYGVVVQEQVKQDHFLAVALTAQATGKTVTMWFSGCTPTNWNTSAPVLISITIGS